MMFAFLFKPTESGTNQPEVTEAQMRVLSLDELEQVSAGAGDHHMRAIGGVRATSDLVPTTRH